MNNLREIQLGAPTTIEGGASPNAELTVQIASAIKTLTLHDEGSKCTKDSALLTTAKLLQQRLNEAAIKQSTWSGMTAVYGPDLPTVIASGGTLHLSVQDASGTPQKAYWQIAEIISSDSGASATISKDGALSLTPNKKIFGIAKAINWNSAEQVLFAFAVDSRLTSIVSGREAEYMNLLSEFPSLMNSLVDTGKRTFIHQQIDANAGYIKTNIVCSADMSFESVVRSEIVVGGNYIFGGNGSTSSRRYYQYLHLDSTNHRAAFGYASRAESHTGVAGVWNEGWHTFFHDINKKMVDNQTFNWAAAPSTSSFAEVPSAPVSLFGTINDTGGAHKRNTTTGNTIDIEHVIIRKNEETHSLVPFVRNDVAGIIDLYDFSFYSNAHTSGSFSVLTEQK